MMFKKTVERVIEKHEEISRTVCDFCNEDITPNGACDGNEVNIEAKLGDVYADADTRVVELFDCCPGCWRKKVLPALETLSGRRCVLYHMMWGRLDSETTKTETT